MLAALHPPTYVHSRMEAQISLCLATHLVDLKPELFIGILGLNSVEEVKRERNYRSTYHLLKNVHDHARNPKTDDTRQ